MSDWSRIRRLLDTDDFDAAADALTRVLTVRSHNLPEMAERARQAAA